MPDPEAFNIIRAATVAGVIYFFIKLLIEGGGIVMAEVDHLP